MEDLLYEQGRERQDHWASPTPLTAPPHIYIPMWDVRLHSLQWSKTYLKLLEIAGFGSRRLFSQGLLDHLCYRVLLSLLPPHNPHVSGAILMQRNSQFKVVFKLLFRQVLQERFTNCGVWGWRSGIGALLTWFLCTVVTYGSEEGILSGGH